MYSNNLNCSIEEKALILKKNLDLIAEKSGLYLLLPIGADHLGIPSDINDQILAINEILKDEYNIKLGSPFDYFKNVSGNFEKFEFNGELRDNSKTFILQGCHSSRLDLKRYNVECTHKLDLVSRFVRFKNAESRYEKVLEHAYKMLLQNQAHDSICGCSTDDVHRENEIRYKKILQIANSIIDELKFESNFEGDRILNLANVDFTGMVEVRTTENLKSFQKIGSKKGFDKRLLTDVNRIPITEDYAEINTYIAEVKNLEPDNVDFIMTEISETDLEIADNYITNSKISLEIIDEQVFINDIPFSLIDFVDLGDSYNFGPKVGDFGAEFKVLRSKVFLKGDSRAILKIDFDGLWDVISLYVTLDKRSDYLKFEFDWNNSQKNHLLQACFWLPAPIETVYSEDMNVLIKRTFDSTYDIRENLPQEKGFEAKTNTAPMQRGLLVDETDNNIGVITKGLTQYEVDKNRLFVPILRATGQISNPHNPARTTPAGPPIEVETLQMIGRNKAELYVFFGNQNAFEKVLNTVYNYVIV